MLEDEVRAFLDEDGVGWRDVTSGLVAGHEATATVRTRADGVVAGVEEATAVFEELGLSTTALVVDGEEISAGQDLLEVGGDAAALLRAERVALNLLGSMSGIATRTRTCVERVAGVATDDAEATRVAATRKTTPGYRTFEKRAVRLGGGDTHRYDLADAVLIKENHVAVIGLDAAIERARDRASFTAKIEVEAETLDQADRAADLGADVVLLDNMSPDECVECVAALAGRDVLVEASGGITPENVADYAAAGVDVVSMGSLTHSANWLDVTMLVED